MGQSPTSDTYNSCGDGLPFYQGRADFGDVFPKLRLSCSHPKKIAQPGAILLSVRAPVGPTNLAQHECCIGRGLAGIHPCGGIEPKFLLFMFRNVEPLISRKGAGSTFNAITKEFVASMEFKLPPLAEQKRIIAKIDELFAVLDQGIESMKKARVQLTAYRQSVLKHAFEGKLTAQWRERNRDDLDTTDQLARVNQQSEARYEQRISDWKIAVRTWEAMGRTGKRPSKPRNPTELPSAGARSDLPPLPDGHVYTYLSTIGEVERGTSKHRPRNDPQLFGGPYPFIQTGEVKAADRIIREYDRTYNELGLAQSRLWPKGTLCITIAANIAETALLGFDGCFPDSVVGFTATETLVLPRYVELFIKSVRTRIEAYAPATAQRNINLVVLESLVIPLCSLQEQRALLDRLEAIFSVINEQRREIEKHLHSADALRQSILRSAFTGQLVTQDATDEPASALLERIRAERDQIAKRETPRTNRKRKTTKVTT